MNDKNDTITFKFDGANVSTEALGCSLLPLAVQVYNLVQSFSDEEVRLLSIENNCVKMTFARTAVAALALTGASLDGVKDIAKFNAATHAINAMLQKRNATLVVEDVPHGHVREFDGKREMPTIPEIHHDVKTTLAIYGDLLDVGGVNPNAHIQSDAFADDVVLDVERDDAKKLAQRLYSQVGVSASVTIRDGRIISGKVLEVIDYAPEDIEEWLRHNTNALGIDAFKGIDIPSFIAEQRI